jgi:hypothetical protein
MVIVRVKFKARTRVMFTVKVRIGLVLELGFMLG